MDQSDHHDDRLFNELESIEENISGLVEYLEGVNTIKHVAERLLLEDGRHQQVILTGAESRRFITDYYFAEEEEDDVLPLIFGDSTAYHQLLILRDTFPKDAADNNHLTIVLNCIVDSEASDYLFASQVTHVFADGSSQVLGKGWKPADLDAIQTGRLGPYISDEDDYIQILNTSKRIKLSPEKFAAQHWRLDQLDNYDRPEDMVESQKQTMDLHPLLDYFEYEYRDYLPRS